MQTADWMLTDMRSPEGAFYASRDADSEGEEGRYYVWTPNAVAALLPSVDYKIFAQRFGLDQDANFEGDWHLTVRKSIHDIADNLAITENDVETAIAASRIILLAERDKRVAPQRDDKQLTAWNALAIRGLAIAGRALARDDLVDAAAEATEFVRNKLVNDTSLLTS